MPAILSALPASRGLAATVVAIAGLVFLPLARKATAGDETGAFFRAHVESILVRCLECHGAKRTRGLDLRARATALEGGENGPVLVPGKPDESRLFRYVAGGKMPPQTKLSPGDVAVLKRWIAGSSCPPSTRPDGDAAAAPS